LSSPTIKIVSYSKKIIERKIFKNKAYISKDFGGTQDKK